MPQAVIWGAAALAPLTVAAGQYAKRPPTNKGPRALGVLEVAANGKAHLIAVTIMLDGKFYDAGAYKADPVPMALHGETVYEALKAGVSQGLFTVAGVMHDNNNGWVADGKWRSTAQIDAEKAEAKAEADKRAQKAPPPEQEIGAPPKLKRAPDSSTTTSPPAESPAPPPAPKTEPNTGTPEPTTAPPNAPASSSSSPSSGDDPNRPMLRHQAPSGTAHEQTKAGADRERAAAADATPVPLKGPIDFIPAISDADGPQPRPYSYQMKPEEEQAFLKKMLAMASEEVRARAAQVSTVPSEKPKAAAAQSKPAHQFQDVQLHVYDLSNSNEPVLVLTANAKLAAARDDLEYMVALVARQDIYGDLHKVFAQTTDNHHLDVLPKYDLIDAVDAAGDGRGELLFRMTSETGSAFGVYSVIGDRLWPLFEGKPGT